MSAASVAERLAAVRAEIGAAAVAAGRSEGAVTLIAVSKRQPLARVVAAYDAGARDFGENTVQALVARAQALAGTGRREARWHFVGRLQRNKVEGVLGCAHLIHSVDRAPLVVALAGAAAAAMAAARGVPPPRQAVLVQVNLGDEPQKGGVAPEHALALTRAVAHEPHLSLAGLMALPPAAEDPRPHFDALAALSRALRRTPWGAGATALSMGMSADFSAAIAAGATMVRVGTAIFGPRPPPGGDA